VTQSEIFDTVNTDAVLEGKMSMKK